MGSIDWKLVVEVAAFGAAWGSLYRTVAVLKKLVVNGLVDKAARLEIDTAVLKEIVSDRNSHLLQLVADVAVIKETCRARAKGGGCGE
jgi:hypothetical protein